MIVPNRCLLCELEDETVVYLFLYYQYSRVVWLAFTEKIGNIIWQFMCIDGGSVADVEIGFRVDVIERFTKKSPCWGLDWMTLATFVWNPWREETEDLKKKNRDIRRPFQLSFNVYCAHKTTLKFLMDDNCKRKKVNGHSWDGSEGMEYFPITLNHCSSSCIFP